MSQAELGMSSTLTKPGGQTFINQGKDGWFSISVTNGDFFARFSWLLEKLRQLQQHLLNKKIVTNKSILDIVQPLWKINSFWEELEDGTQGKEDWKNASQSYLELSVSFETSRAHLSVCISAETKEQKEIGIAFVYFRFYIYHSYTFNIKFCFFKITRLLFDEG